MSKVTIGQIAEALGITKRSAERRAIAEGWTYEIAQGRGAPRLYVMTNVSVPVRDAVLRHTLKADSRTIPILSEPAPLPAPIEAREADLKDWQREIMLARLALVQEVERLARAAGKMAAINALVSAEAAGELAPAIARAAAKANARKGESRRLSASTLRRWLDAFDASGRRPIVLAPAPSAAEKPLPPAWMADFLDVWAIPSKPSIARAARELQKLRPDIALPPERTIQQHIAKLPVVERNRGRMGPRELRQLKAFVRRDISDLWPTAVYVTDGHTHHEFIAHPQTGKPFRPEITATIDVFTRRITGWSVALAEATWGTLGALRHSFTTSGVPAIWYVDRGSGFNNDVIDDPLTGLLARFDVKKENSLPYRSQARGVIERFHRTWIEAARLSANYAGTDMDPEARKRREKAIKGEIEAVGRSNLLVEWPAFVEWCERQVAEYNARPHSELPRYRDANGKLVHLSPDAVWNRCLAEGWRPDLVDENEVDALFRPQIRRQTRRGELQLFTNRYFAIELEEFHEQDVLVSYDIHDASKVWVFTTSQQLICEATFHGNSVSYFPVSVLEQAHENRVNNQVKRAEKRVIAAEENRGVPIIDARPRPAKSLLNPIIVGAASELELVPTVPANAGISAVPAISAPKAGDDVALAKWVVADPSRLTASDAAYLRDRIRNSSPFRLRLEVDGIDHATVAALCRDVLSKEASA